jgi:transposase-like protein
MKKTKRVLGKKGQKGRPPKHGISFKRMIAMRYNQGDESLSQIAKEFNIPKVYVSRWAKQFSSELAVEQIVIPMTEQEEKDYELLKKQNQALKEKLEYEQMRNFALETMVDLAKSELGIDLRKNSGAKQPKE